MHAKRSATLFFPGTCIFLCRYEFERRTGKLKEIGSSVRDEKTADQKNVLMIHCKTAKNCQQSYMFRTVCFKIKTCSKFKGFKFQMFHVWSTHSCCASMKILADLLSWMMRNMLPVSMHSLSAAHKKEMCQSNTSIPCKNMFTPHVVSKPHLTWCVAFGTRYSPRRFGPETLFCGNHPQPFATVSRLVQNSMRIAKTLQKKQFDSCREWKTSCNWYRVAVPQTVYPHWPVLTERVTPVLDQGAPPGFRHFSCKFSREMVFVKCPIAFRPRRLAQTAPFYLKIFTQNGSSAQSLVRGLGLQRFTCQFSHKRELLQNVQVHFDCQGSHKVSSAVLVCGILPVIFCAKWLLWNVQMHFDDAASHNFLCRGLGLPHFTCKFA